jgi:hypothetical protein
MGFKTESFGLETLTTEQGLSSHRSLCWLVGLAVGTVISLCVGLITT